ncbi:MAG: RNA polymerase sigma factor [Deltaproteobacteria bacterium]|nr:MAG: RNA polymerase sigma factor [Deltaproteobacteria bacterium]
MDGLCIQPQFSYVDFMTDNPSCSSVVARKDTYKNFGEFVAKYQKRAFFIAFDLVNDIEDARDLSQEAFARAYERLGQFRDESSLYTWFYRILVNLCMDFRRRKRRWWKIFQPEGDTREDPRNSLAEKPAFTPGPAERYDQKELSQKVRKALDVLTAKQKAVFILKNYHGMPIKEIATILKIAEGTVKSHLFRAVRELQIRLKDDYGYNYGEES